MTEQVTPTETTVAHSQSEENLPFGIYDAVLLAIPALFVIGFILSLATALTVHIMMTMSATVGSFLLLHVLFINPPIDV